jgi:hypothetical protein
MKTPNLTPQQLRAQAKMAKAKALRGTGNPNHPPEMVADGGFVRFSAPPAAEQKNYQKHRVIHDKKG